MELNGSVEAPKENPAPRRSLSSSPGLQYGALVNSVTSLTTPESQNPPISNRQAYVTMAVLCYINLLNYMERYTIAGVLLNIQTFFKIRDSTAALLQTVFICSFLLLAPLFGYLGDRYNRKFIMIGGLCVWLLTAAASSFVTESYFWLLALLRGLVGIGEASYSTIAPTIIGDLFTGGKRSIMICIFYIFIPVGSGLGYIAGAGSAYLTGDWHWALRITPIMGVIGLILMIFLCPNPARGAAETNGEGVVAKSSYLEDIKYLLKNYIFGAVTVATGILGGAVGTTLSRTFRDKVPYADPLICGVGMLGSVPCIFIIIFVAASSIPATYVFIFCGELLLSLNWAVMADILLYVVVPTRRATAEALQISFAHLLGDAGSPYLIGVISDAVRSSKPDDLNWSFHSLKVSLLVCPFIGILGGAFFLFTTKYITEDSKAVLRLIEGNEVLKRRTQNTSMPLRACLSMPTIQFRSADCKITSLFILRMVLRKYLLEKKV
uniref:SPNS lysolipid transporter 3, sphingosine-1-phosphate (putative) n=1 Tax=Oryzias sinensis TaxID=183150 RepID=A0A8C7ZCD6_9TELE